MKAIKKATRQDIKLAALFVAGIFVATLAWWQSDRLDLAFGSGNSIDMMKPAIASSQQCAPNQQPQISRRYEGCNVVTSTVTCAPSKWYVTYRKTRSGIESAVSSAASSRSVEQIAYQPKTDQKNETLQSKLQQLGSDITSMKNGRKQADLQKDQVYQAKIKDQQELTQVARQNPKCISNK